MNRLLNFNVQTSHSTNAGETRIRGWDIIGKTGTTDADNDSWFCGCSPYSAAAIWVGYDTPKTVPDATVATKLWKILMEDYLKDKEPKQYTFPDGLVVAKYCPYTGLLANTGCGASYYGYYNPSNIPEYCTYHGGFNEPYQTWGEIHANDAESTVGIAPTSSGAYTDNNYNNNNYNNNNYNYNNQANQNTMPQYTGGDYSYDDDDGGDYDYSYDDGGDYDYDDGGNVGGDDTGAAAGGDAPAEVPAEAPAAEVPAAEAPAAEVPAADAPASE